MKKPPIGSIKHVGGRERERRDVVMYLRKQADKFRDDGNPTVRLIVRDLAMNIEHGTHLRKPKYLTPTKDDSTCAS